MDEHNHTLMDGRLHLYRREHSRFWQCSTYLGGRNHRQSTHEESLVLAKEFARDWYMERYTDERRRRRGLPPYGVDPVASQTVVQPAAAAPEVLTDRRRRPVAYGPTFKQAADAFLREAAVVTAGERSDYYMTQKEQQVRVHLMPFFGGTALSEVTAGLVQEYRVHRATTNRDRRTNEPKRPARNTLHGEIVTLRQILKTANRKGWLVALPDMSAPYKKSGKVSHRAWFSPEEYKRLYQASRDRAKNPKKERWRTAAENLHDYILLMVNTGLRPDEVLGLEYRDVAIVTDDATDERILEIKVRGKRGVGYCKSMPGAVMPFRRLKDRNKGQPTDRLFPSFQRELFNTLLKELDLREDREGQRRTAYSLRHTYICLRLMEGADIYQIAKNCRTSVEMIQTFYASHIASTLDAAAINVRKPKPAKRPARQEAADAAL
ncbi:tyrosine-type recombinase/integrase [Phenylobacterium sp.]|uniref:tyrosine-type recombinase/integrase n=1 Tax=Phenylobacterium sp. TaxID=1871053 RepID=UPI002734FC54|nr:tyrosine-type recombinase/integrase [Phenylobacterium sp.]MDP3854497.1 site-specific integrase [Phenylobacterium sp.]